jgi:hypothetical protein
MFTLTVMRRRICRGVSGGLATEEPGGVFVFIFIQVVK